MKKIICMVAFLVAFLGFCSLAMAKDVDGIDVFAGNSLSAIVSMDVPGVAKNELAYSFTAGILSDDLGMETVFAKLGIDSKKDVKSVVVAVDVDWHFCAVVDVTKSVKDAWAKVVTEQGSKTEKYGKYDVVRFAHKGNGVVGDGALLSDTRVLLCQHDFDTHTVLDNVAKPKALKAADGVLYTAYSQTSAQADIRVAAKMLDAWRKDLASLKLLDGDIAVSMADVDTISLSADFEKDVSIDARALTKSDKIAADAATLIHKEYVLGPSQADKRMDFLPSVVKVASSKQYLTLHADFTGDQVKKIEDRIAEAVFKDIEKIIVPAIVIGVVGTLLSPRFWLEGLGEKNK